VTAQASALRVLRIGERARCALLRSGGDAIPIAALAGGPYFAADSELIWVGARLPAMHPRAVITTGAKPARGALHFDALPAHGWSPRLPRLGEAARARLVAAAARLASALPRAEPPRGFGALLAGAPPAFPLELATERVRALARAYRTADPDAVADASIALLGLGTGLTPSGDDLAGAALFGRQLLSPERRAWQLAGERLAREAGRRSHTVSAALLEDLVRVQSFAPLHAIVDALAENDDAAALAAARELVAIGHSSGWDMLAGLVIGVTGSCPAAGAPARRG
jgi:hypothetical protein